MTFVPVETLEQVLKVALSRQSAGAPLNGPITPDRPQAARWAGPSLAQAIVFYISGHGFGHASRSIEVINAILAQRPETRIGVRTSAPRWLFDLTVKGKVTFSTLEMRHRRRAGRCADARRGRQHPPRAAFHSDLVTRAASETRVAPRARRRAHRRRHPAAGVRRRRVGRHPVDRARQLHVGLDLRRLPARPAGAVAAAGHSRRLRQGVDGAAAADVGRIRELLQRQGHPVRRAARDAHARGGLQGAQAAGGQADRARLVRRLRAAGTRHRRAREVQEVHGGHDREPAARPRARRRRRPPNARDRSSAINEEAMYDAGVRYEDLVGAAEAVVTKPGYGIISECIANDTADSLHLARPLPRVRRARRRDAEVPAHRRSSTTTTCSRASGSRTSTSCSRSRSSRRSRRPTAPTSLRRSC